MLRTSVLDRGRERYSSGFVLSGESLVIRQGCSRRVETYQWKNTLLRLDDRPKISCNFLDERTCVCSRNFRHPCEYASRKIWLVGKEGKGGGSDGKYRKRKRKKGNESGRGRTRDGNREAKRDDPANCGEIKPVILR